MKRTLGLVGAFIENRGQEYSEPRVFGNPTKGDEMGDSKARYLASLYLVLTNLRGEEISKRIGVSHGLLRKWHSDRKFQDRMYSRLYEFEKFVEAQLRDVIKGQTFQFTDVNEWS